LQERFITVGAKQLQFYSLYSKTPPFLDQELISYRYSFCWCSSCSVRLLKFFLLGRHYSKKVQYPRLGRFKSDWDEMRPYCSWSRYASIDEVCISICHHTFKMGAMTLFHTEKCCHLVTADSASGRDICSSVRQLLVRS